MSWPVTINGFSSQSEGDLGDDPLQSVHTTDKGDAHVLRTFATREGRQDCILREGHLFTGLAFPDSSGYQVFIWQLPCAQHGVGLSSEGQHSQTAMVPEHLLCVRHCAGHQRCNMTKMASLPIISTEKGGAKVSGNHSPCLQAAGRGTGLICMKRSDNTWEQSWGLSVRCLNPWAGIRKASWRRRALSRS